MLSAIWLFVAEANSQAFAPSSRVIHPKEILRTTGSATPKEVVHSNAVTLSGANASVTYDLGQETAGIPTIQFYDASCGRAPCVSSSLGLPSLMCTGTCQGLGLSYSESAPFAGIGSDQSTINLFQDGVVYLPIQSNTKYTVPAKWARGGFRYLTLSLGPETVSSTQVTIRLVNVYFTASPDRGSSQLNSYTGFFNCSDDALNQIWYAGAYTLQLNTIAANTSCNHSYVLNGGGWAQDSIATGLDGNDVYLADGAKRDRNPWAGDQSIALRSAFTSQYHDNLLAVRNTIRECLILQDTDLASPTYGYFPYAGSPLGDLLKLFPAFIAPYGSDTYHLWTIRAFAEYILVTRDAYFLAKYSSQIATGMNATYSFVRSDGLFNGTRTSDWGRIGQGGQNAALNALYYDTLRKLIQLNTRYPSNTILSSNTNEWARMAIKLKTSFNAKLWDEAKGLYRDNTTAAGSNVYPQDGNSFAVNFNLTTGPMQIERITTNLAARLTKYGSPCPELPGSISPFIGSHEVMSHFLAAESTGNTTPALDLIKTQWGYMRQAFSNTTFVEGYGSDGSLSYGFYQDHPAFVSLAHAWSTGPVYSLVQSVVGIAATDLDVSVGDGAWRIKPIGALSDELEWAAGAIDLPRGRLAVSWKKGDGVFELTLSGGKGAVGTVYVPLPRGAGGNCMVTVNERAVEYMIDGPFARLPKMRGGMIRVRITM